MNFCGWVLYLDSPHLACLGFPDYHSMDYEELEMIGLGLSWVIVFTKALDHKGYYQPVKKAGFVA